MRSCNSLCGGRGAELDAARANLARICESDPQKNVDFEIIEVLADHRKGE